MMASDWKHIRGVQYSKASQTVWLEEYLFPNNSDFIKELNEKINNAKKYTLEQLNTIEKNNKFPKTTYKTRGFISFMNYMKEVKDPKSKVINEKLPVRGTRQSVFTKKHLERIQVVAVNPNSFMPTKEQKDAGIWDENSEQAFTMNVLSLLNRLTQQNMQITIQELKPLLKTPERVTFVADTLTEKASQEHAFSSLYATFTMKLRGIHSLESIIIKKTMKKFNEYSELSLNDDSDTHELTGCSKFVACLIKIKSISINDGIECIKRLITKLEAPKIASSNVEMFLIFVQNIGAEFAKKVPLALWERFLKVKRERELTSRVKYLLVDVEEIYSEMVLGVSKKQMAVSKPLPIKSDAKMFLVRDAFTNYKEECDNISVDLPIDEFLRAASDLFPDQTKDPATYCEFICYICERMKPKKNIIIEILGKCAAEYCKNKIEGDSPKMWGLFDDLLYYMIIKKILNCSDVQQIMKSFPELHESNIENGMKWFLCDKHNFTKAIDLPDFPSAEVRDALMMPDTIHKPVPETLRMSRLISLSIMRSIAEAICEHDDPYEELKQYIDYLELIEDRQIGFDKEWNSIIEYYNFNFTLDDIYDLFDLIEEEEEFDEPLQQEE
ncbi:hypothetical protein TRFO_03895 [Tritrichomonas foetus]|uniref:MIF4G domain-containing protein n=1 Tax=Tritrichomonas foetus TaxID=1144522 RepID=A0A1J4KL57_9EUKA|nr:hypothetical protein TRFO_03895 [Tritrichomonas foetus]|eukprot:OHT11672.1 hypothetical protein TRFO_03895 [Tritrichomonas foetus]